MENESKIIVPPSFVPPRYSHKPFPPYRYVMGLFPHPTEDNGGHSFGKSEREEINLDIEKWYQNEIYLYGIDLYNNAYWWEAHEALEQLWQETLTGDITHHYFQGLIKISAAFLKWHVKQRRGVERLYNEGHQHLSQVYQQEKIFMGINLEKYLKNLEHHFAEVIQKTSLWPNPVEDYPFLILEKSPPN